MLADCGARVVVTDAAHAERRRRAGPHAVSTVVVVGGPAPGRPSYAELLGREPATRRHRDPDDLDATAFMLYTSGTTGRPKGVELTLRGCLWVVAACWAPIAGLGPDDMRALRAAAVPLLRPGPLRARGRGHRRERADPAEVLLEPASSSCSPTGGHTRAARRADDVLLPGPGRAEHDAGRHTRAPAAGRDLGGRDPARRGERGASSGRSASRCSTATASPRPRRWSR